MERVEIPRDDVRKDNTEPIPAWGKQTNGLVFIRCACGLCMDLDGHAVESNGDVNPSLWHDVPECGWHVMGRLLGWEG